MAIESSLVGVLGAGTTILQFSSNTCTKGWANTHVNNYSSLTPNGANATIVSNGLQLPPGNYAIAWSFYFGDSTIPPTLGLQTWLEISTSSTRYGHVSSDPGFPAESTNRNRQTGGSIRLSLGSTQIIQFWVCNGANVNRSINTSSSWALVYNDSQVR